ncbi:MAG: hypothetical protein FJZ04_02165 [Candidatus Moranbacteria bacterium]|nr:hypothetical protein [Candidatus Moranbacteria bacterium]
MNKTKTLPRVKARKNGFARITISVPPLVQIFLEKQIPKRQVSQFISDAIVERIPEVIAKKKNLHPLKEFIQLGKKYKSKMTVPEIIAAIHKGRK